MLLTFRKISSVVMVYLFVVSAVCFSSSAIVEPYDMSLSLIASDTILYVGGSGPGNYSKIQDAVENASEGDTVFVYSGFYEENILISTSIQLVGEGKNSTIIDGGAYSSVVTILSDGSMVQGFTIQNAKNDIHYAGIEISTAKDVIVKENIIQNNGGLGISILGLGSSRARIEMNTIRNNSYGVYLFDSPKAKILTNNINNNGEGIYVVGSSASQIMNNSVANRGLGIHLESTNGLLVSGNWIVKNAHGIYMFNSSDITFEVNTIRWNRWYGLWMKDSSYSIVDGNMISDNIDVGLFLESSFDIIVKNNTFWDNDNGIYLKDSAGNIIQNNNLRNYKMNACFVAHILFHRRNIWKLNYWERARMFPYPILGCIKLEKITISWVNFDWTPLRQPPQTVTTKKFNSWGNILYVGGNGPNNYSSIQNAIDDAHHNDTVYVFNGTYYEAIVIDKPLQLIGENKTVTILEGNGTRDIITIIADYVTVNGFAVQNGHFNILVNHSSYANITGNTIGSGLHGVSVQNGCRFVTISKNSFQENVYGIRLFSSTDVTVSYNNIYSFKINAFYFGTSIGHGRHHWYQNYWGKPRYLPYIIPGKIRLDNFSLTWLNIDWFPSTSPYLDDSSDKYKYYRFDL